MTDLKLLAAKYVLDDLDVDKLREIAVDAVCDGVDGRSMVFLAGATPADTPADLRELFVSALREQGVQLPSTLDAMVHLIQHVASDVAEARRSVSDGVGEIGYLLHCAEHDADFVGTGDPRLGLERVFALHHSADAVHSAQRRLEIDAAIIKECAAIGRR